MLASKTITALKKHKNIKTGKDDFAVEHATQWH